MFRLLGAVSAFDLRLNRIRINFLPLNIAAAILLLAGATGGLGRLLDGPTEMAPRPVTVADLAAGLVPSGSYVSVIGVADPNVVLNLSRRSSTDKLRDTKERLLLLQDGGKPGVWLAGASAGASGVRATYIGLVRALPSAARNATTRDFAVLDGRTPSTEFLLEHGSKPWSFGASIMFLLISVPPLILLGRVHVLRHEIFRPRTTATIAGGNPDEPIDLRVSARMKLKNSRRRRFLEVGAELKALPDGGVAVLAAVDASTYVFGFRAIAREGTWALAIPSNADLSVTLGELAFGLEVRPAARVVFRRDGQAIDRLTLTFGSIGQRTRLLHALNAHFAHQGRAAVA